MTTVREIKAEIRKNEQGKGSAVVARTLENTIVRIYDVRRRAGQLQGRSLASGQWVAIASAE